MRDSWRGCCRMRGMIDAATRAAQRRARKRLRSAAVCDIRAAYASHAARFLSGAAGGDVKARGEVGPNETSPREKTAEAYSLAVEANAAAAMGERACAAGR